MKNYLYTRFSIETNGEVDLIGLNKTEVDLIGLNKNCLIFRGEKFINYITITKEKKEPDTLKQPCLT